MERMIGGTPTGVSHLDSATNLIKLDVARLERLFPDADPGVEPANDRILIQYPIIPEKAGSVWLPDSAREANRVLVTVAKIRRIAVNAFMNMGLNEPYPNGPWAKEGDLIRTVKYITDTTDVRTDEGIIRFGFINCFGILGHVVGDTYLDAHSL